MGEKLYVGGLTYSITDAQLKKLFAAYGTVKSTRVITDKVSGRSRGLGFVEMSSEDEARNAARALTRTQLDSRYVGRSVLKN